MTEQKPAAVFPDVTSVLRFPALLAVAIFSCVGVVGAAERPWLLLEASRYKIFSQLDEKETRAWAREFDEFTHALGEQMVIDDRLLRPLTVVLFKKDQDFRRYKPRRPNGNVRNVSGFFASRETWCVIGLSGGFRREETRRIIFHEGVHWFTDATTEYPPIWLREGLAEVYSTFKVKRGKATWGYEIDSHIRTLKNEPLLPLQDLLNVSQTDRLFDENSRTGVLYAQSWALVHLLLFGNESGYENAIDRYTHALAQGVSTEQAFEQAFGRSFSKVRSDLESHYLRDHYEIHQSDLTGYDPGRHVLRESSTSQVQSALARLALGSGHLGLAQEHARQAVASDPTDPSGHEMLAWVMVQQALNQIGYDQHIPFVAMREEWPRVGEILKHSKQAADLGSTDAWMYVLLGYHCEFPGFLNALTANEIAQYAADQYTHAIALQPNILMAYQRLAVAVGSLDSNLDENRNVLVQGHELYPRDAMIVLGLAMIAEKTGDHEEASKLLKRATGDNMLMIPAVNFLARQIESRLTEDTLQSRIDQLVANNEYSKAVDLYDLEIPRAKNPVLRKTLEQKRFQVVYGMKMQLALDALDRDDTESAIRHLQEMLSWERLSGDQRENVTGKLRQVNRKRLESF